MAEVGTKDGPSAGSASAARVDHVAVGAGDLAAMSAFFQALGFAPVGDENLVAESAAALYGLPGSAREVVLGVPGVATGRLRIIEVPADGGHARDGFRRGGHAIDLYTTDMAASVEAASAAGALVGPVADYPFGPVHLTQAMAIGPDGVEVVFVGIDHRLPSALDEQPALLHSQVHSLVWSVDDIDAVTSFFTDVVGLDLRSSFPIDVPAVSDFMMLAHHAPIRMTVMASSDVAPPRFELLAYGDVPGSHQSSLPLRPGAILPSFGTSDVDALHARLANAGARVGEVVPIDGGKAFTATAPGGVDLDVRGPA